MKKKSVFIAVNLPEEIKRKLSVYRNQFSEVPARWTKEQKLHITIAFLGFVSEQEIKKLKQSLSDIACHKNRFKLKIKKIAYNSFKDSSMIWALVDDSEDLTKIVKDFSAFSETFIPHITMARIKSWDFRKLDEIPEIDQDVSLEFDVESIELMESKLNEYVIIESFPLLNKKK
jgi:RNA 2',3'-cyclic 3'-phosphodiesterase